MPALPASPTLSQPPPLDSAKPPNDESDVNVRRGPSSVWFRKRPARNVEDRPPIKRALLIAFNYENRKGEGWALQTNEDAVRVADLLKRRFGYLEENIKRITDRQEQAEALHSRVTVRREMLNFVSGVRPGDQLFFYFAGHGDQVANFTGTETDDHDEEICTPTHDFDPPVWPPTAPIDRLEEGLRDDELKDDSHLSAFSKATGKLKDNILHKILVRKLPAGCRLTALIDACNSGTMLDLPHYHCNHIEDPQVGLPEAPSPQPCKACAEKKGIFPKPKRQDTWNSFTAPRQTRFFRTIINTLSSSALPTQPEAPTPTPTPSPSPAPPSVNVNDNTSTNEQSTGLLSTVFAPFSWVYNAFSRVGYQDPPSNDSASIKPTEPPSDTPTHPAAPENDTATPRTPTRHDTKDSLNPFEQAKISLRRRCGSPERQSRDHEAEERLKADVVCWSACRDGMRTFGSKSGGYMTEAFCNTFNNPDLSFEQAFLEINRRLRAKGIEMQKKYPSTEEVDPGTYKEWGSLQAQLGSYRTLTHSDVICI